MAKQRGLGKGLSSLIPSVSSDSSNDIVLKQTTEDFIKAETSVDCDVLFPNPFQPRKAIDTETLQNLASSIKEHGVIQPVLVRRTETGYQIIAGERRWRATQIAGLRKIPIRILEITDSQAMELALVENLQREDLNAIEIAQGIQEIISKLSLTHEEIAERIGLSRAAVTNKLRLLQLPKEVISLLENEDITEGHARALLSLPSADKIIEYANIAVNRELNVRQLEQLVKNISVADKINAAFPRRATQEADFQEEIYRIKTNFKLNIKIAGNRKGMGLMINGLKRWQVQILLEYIESHSEELFPKE